MRGRSRLQEDVTTTTIDPPRPAPARPRPQRTAVGKPRPALARAPAPPARPRSRPRARGLQTLVVFVVLAVAVVASTGGWRSGSLIIDGPGVSMWLRLLLKYWDAGQGIPSWIPDMWGGAAMWDMVSAFHLIIFLPLARLLGTDAAAKTGIVAAQVAGAWGTFVLARSMWSQVWPSAVAGLIYGLHPLFASHGPLSGFLPSLWVFAVTPWLLWSLQKALRRHGSRYVALAGLFVGFAVVEQAEQAYSLVLLCAIVLLLEVARARRGSGAKGVPGVLFRAGVVVAIGVGVAFHWLFPFLKVSKYFVLMPPEDVRAGIKIFGGGLAQNPGAFLSRGSTVSGDMDFERLFGPTFDLTGTFASGFYLSWVCIALTLVTIVWLARRSDDDGTLSAILLASALGIWLTLGMVPIADGGLADRGRVLGLAAIGGISGLVAGTFLRRLDLGRRTGAIAAAVAVFLFALPYIAPVSALQRIIPLLEHLRFPRFYPLAALGLALGAAYPIILVKRWATDRKPQLAPLFTAAVCLAVAGAFLVDVHPYRSYYRLDAPESEIAYREATVRLAAFPQEMRVATPYFGDPSSVANLLRNGIETSVGWPQPQATPNMWRLTGEVLAASPPGFRNRALGLSATAFVAADQLSKLDAGPRRVTEVNLEPNPAANPIVRAYEQVVVVPDSELTPELATALATRYVGVVKGGPELANAIGPGAHAISDESPCVAQDPADGEPWVAAEVAMACSMHMWVGAREKLSEVALGDGVGAVFTSPVADLRGISVWLDGGAGRTELVLRELESDNTFGREVVRTRAAGLDDNGMALFPFDAHLDSAGRRYVFLLTCDGCGEDDEPKLLISGAPRGPQNLVVGSRLDGERAAAFSLQYARRMPEAPPSVTVQARRPGPGRWEIAVSGAHPSVVVVAESWFPGWRATVDGKDVDVVEADGAFLGVPVGAGDHEVTLSYHRPSAAAQGRVVTGLTLAACIALILAPGQPGRRRRRRDRRSGVPGPPATDGQRPRDHQAGQPG